MADKEAFVLAKLREITMMEDDDEIDLSSTFRQLGMTSILVSQLCKEVDVKFNKAYDWKSLGVTSTISNLIDLMN